MKKLCSLCLLLCIALSFFAAELSDGSSYGAVAIASAGDLPSGYFSKAQNYLPGDNIAVTNPRTGVTINVLNLGSLDESDSVVLLLTPEAAAKLGMSESSSLRVKVSRRPDNFDDIASGIAILSYGGDALAEAPSRPVENLPPPADSAGVQESDPWDGEIPADGDAEDGSLWDSGIPADGAEESDPWDSEIPADGADENDGGRVEIGGVELPDFGSSKVQPFPGMEDAGRGSASALVQEEDAAPLTGPEEEVPEEPFVFEESPLEHIAGEPAVPAEPKKAQPPAVEEELLADTMPPEIEETPVTPPAVEEELLADATSLPVIEELSPREERVAELDENIIDGTGTALPPAGSGEAVTREPEVQLVSDTSADETEYEEVTETVERVEKSTEIVLVPTQPLVPPPAPESSAGADKKTGKPSEGEPKSSATQPAAAGTPSSAVSSSASKVPVLKQESDLKKNSCYVQIATVSRLQSGEQLAAKYPRYPIVLVELAGGKGYKVLVGPLTGDEYGAVLEKFKAFGYKDAFVKRTK